MHRPDLARRYQPGKSCGSKSFDFLKNSTVQYMCALVHRRTYVRPSTCTCSHIHAHARAHARAHTRTSPIHPTRPAYVACPARRAGTHACTSSRTHACASASKLVPACKFMLRTQVPARHARTHSHTVLTRHLRPSVKLHWACCTHVYTHACTHDHAHVYAHVHAHTHAHVHAHVCTMGTCAAS